MVIAFLFAAAIIVVGGGALFFFLTISPGYSDPSAVPSTVAAQPPGRYSSAIDESKRLARALVVEENLPGLSVAVAVNGETVWAEGFGYANVERRTPVTPRTRFRLGSVFENADDGGAGPAARARARRSRRPGPELCPRVSAEAVGGHHAPPDGRYRGRERHPR
jgi:hypothetical protein